MSDHATTLQKYYASLESRVGYQLLLGGTRHFGYYDRETSWPLPIGQALRRMEESLFQALNCPKTGKVLDAGCGVGHVALYMARRGDYSIDCIDIVSRHVGAAQANIKAAGMENRITARLGDYHHLEDIEDSTYDGIYTMETFVHSTNPLNVLKEFLRILEPGGHIAMNEYEHDELDKSPSDLADAMKAINKHAAMPANAAFDRDVLKELMIEAGFQNVELKDLSVHVWPMLRLFYTLAFIPYQITKLFGIEHRFINTFTGIESYRGRHIWRYIQVTGTKKMD